jgi:hypothetical protein
LTSFPESDIIKVQKRWRYPTMMDWEIMENYEELVEVAREWLEQEEA